MMTWVDLPVGRDCVCSLYGQVLPELRLIEAIYLPNSSCTLVGGWVSLTDAVCRKNGKVGDAFAACRPMRSIVCAISGPVSFENIGRCSPWQSRQRSNSIFSV